MYFRNRFRRGEIFCFSCLIMIMLLVSSIDIGFASVTPPVSVSFTCNPYTMPNYYTWSPTGGDCGSLDVLIHQKWTGPVYTQAVADANYPGGAGGNGLRVWVYDGTNLNTSTLGFVYAKGLREFWIRFYMRYQQGFTWESANGPLYHKILYNYVGNYDAHSGFEWDNAIFNYTDVIQTWVNSGGVYPSTSNKGWLSLFPSNVSDGSWHCYEAHFKMDTNGSNGIAEGWIDGVQKFSHTNANFDTVTAGWTYTAISVNQRSPANARSIGSPAYVDFDDIAISTSGYIGCIGGGGEVGPLAPSGLLIIE